MTLVLCILLASAFLIESCVLAHVLKVFRKDEVPAQPLFAKHIAEDAKLYEMIGINKAVYPGPPPVQKNESAEKPKRASSSWVAIKNQLENEVSE